MRVLLSGGGTAGHINPALAIAETIRKNDPGAEIAFVGIRNGKEAELIPRAGYPLYFVESMGIRRSLSLKNVKALALAITSPYLKGTTRILDEFQPDIVIGTGGYACWPIMAAAARRHIPTALHESNSIPGLTVKRLQRKVDRIWVNFEQTVALLKVPHKTVRVGNPLQNGFGAIDRKKARAELGISDDAFVLLSYGGSLGAEEVNRAVLKLMKDFSSQNPSVVHFHATGKRDFEECCALYEKAALSEQDGCVMRDYIFDMPRRMAAADLVISRAGAMTLSELALMGRASILIPSPYVADNHQYRNARALADAGAALLVEEKELAEGMLTEAVLSLYGNRVLREQLSRQIIAFADVNANRRIYEEICKLTKHKEKEG